MINYLMLSFLDLINGLIITFIIGGIVDALVSDFVLVIKIDKRIFKNFINGFIFYCLMYYIEINNDKLQTLPSNANTTV